MKIVIKIGTQAILTPDGKILESALQAIVDKVVALQSEGHQVILVSSGAVAFGRRTSRQLLRREYGHTTAEKQVLASLGQHELMHAYATRFMAHDILVAQVLLTKQDF